MTESTRVNLKTVKQQCPRSVMEWVTQSNEVGMNPFMFKSTHVQQQLFRTVMERVIQIDAPWDEAINIDA